MPTEAVVLCEDGSIMLPEVILEEFALGAGERLTIFTEGGAIKILRPKMALESIREGKYMVEEERVRHGKRID